MGFRIENGKGGQYEAEVNSKLQLSTKAIIETEAGFISESDGLTFSWANATYDPDAGDTILLVKNTSTVKNLFIDSITISTDTETIVQVHLITADVTVAGTTVTGVNLNTTSNNVADASAAADETGNTQGGIIWAGEVQAASDPYHIDTQGAIILGQNKSIGVDFVSATTAGNVVITGHYK